MKTRLNPVVVSLFVVVISILLAKLFLGMIEMARLEKELEKFTQHDTQPVPHQNIVELPL
jgi:hypothetical protein